MPKQKTVARRIIHRSRQYGARFRNSEVRLRDLQRKKVSWLSKSILIKLGVPPKPGPNSTCPKCGAKSSSFQLDHMGPWRQYVAAMAGPHIRKGYIKLCYVRALYNDPDNLWWICQTCNLKKSDYISQDGSFPTSGIRGRDVDIDDIIS